MTYEDPRSGRERNLGQDDVGNSTGSLIVGIVFLAAIVFGGWYFYNHSQKVADTTATQPATSSTAQNNPAQSNSTENNSAMTPQSSGPGVEGATGGKNGPAAQPENNSSSTGASTGNTGVGGDNTNIDNNTTVPSQDATGVKGAAGNKNGPAVNTPAPSNSPSAPTTP